MRPLHLVFAGLTKSPFRMRFRLGRRERDVADRTAPEDLERHAREIIHARLSAASPRNDGRQTPMRGHPVFIAQHATATCCRGCLAKWHGIGKDRELSAAEVDQVVEAILRWFGGQRSAPALPVPSARRANEAQMRLPLD